MNHPGILSILAVFALTTGLLPAQRDRRELDHVGAYNFTVEIDGVSAGYFSSVDGLSMELEVIEYQDGDDLFLRKRPGRVKFSNITLKRGYIVEESMYEWWRSIMQNPTTILRKTISIVLQDKETEAPVQRWDLLDCWPTKWKLGGFDGKDNDVMVEEITLAVENIRRG